MLKPLCFAILLTLLCSCQKKTIPIKNAVKILVVDKKVYYIPTHIIVCLDKDCKVLTAIKEAITCVNETCMKWKAQYEPLEEDLNDGPPEEKINADGNKRCNPNFYIGSHGAVHLKPECFVK